MDLRTTMHSLRSLSLIAESSELHTGTLIYVASDVIVEHEEYRPIQVITRTLGQTMLHSPRAAAVFGYLVVDLVRELAGSVSAAKLVPTLLDPWQGLRMVDPQYGGVFLHPVPSSRFLGP